MKIKYILIIFFVGVGFELTGMIFKINHMPGGDGSFLICGILKFIAVLLLLHKVLTGSKFNELINS